MIKIIFRSLLLLLLIVGCRQNRPVKECLTYKETADPALPANLDWNEVKPGLSSALGSVDLRYPRSSVPDIIKENVWNGAAWRGEEISVQIVLWSKDPARQVEFYD